MRRTTDRLSRALRQESESIVRVLVWTLFIPFECLSARLMSKSGSIDGATVENYGDRTGQWS